MEDLTGICLKKFEKWLDEQQVAPYRTMFNSIPLIVQHSYIIKFFDEHNIHICAYVPNITGYWAHSLENKAKYDSREEATSMGIIEACYLFNENNSK